MIQTFKRALTYPINEAEKDWNKFLQDVVNANNIIAASNAYSPCQLIYGIHPIQVSSLVGSSAEEN